MDFNASDHLLIIYSPYIKYLRKKREYNEAVNQLFINFTNAYDSVRREVLYITLIAFRICIKE